METPTVQQPEGEQSVVRHETTLRDVGKTFLHFAERLVSPLPEKAPLAASDHYDPTHEVWQKQ